MPYSDQDHNRALSRLQRDLDAMDNTARVVNLSTGEEFFYVTSTPQGERERLSWLVHCLIVSSLLEAGRASSIHHPPSVEAERQHVTLGKRTASIGDLCVILR